MNDSIVSTLTNLLALVPTIFVFIGASYYLSKIVKLDAILLFIGSGISLLLSVFYSFVMPYIVRSDDSGLSSLTSYYTVAGLISVLAHACFAVGFFILVSNTIGEKKIVQNFFPPSDGGNQNR